MYIHTVYAISNNIVDIYSVSTDVWYDILSNDNEFEYRIVFDNEIILYHTSAGFMNQYYTLVWYDSKDATLLERIE